MNYESMDFDKFRHTIHDMLVNGYIMDDDQMNDLYSEFKKSKSTQLRKWIQFWFDDWKVDTHGFEIKYWYKE